MIYRILRVVARVFFGVVFRLQVSGLENIPRQGPVVICSNHISNWDPPLLGTPLPRKIHYMAKEELFRIPGLAWLITALGAFPVKRGGVSKESIRVALRLLEEGHMLGIFPQGTRGETGGMGKKGAASLAIRTNAIVIPTAIIGEYRLFRRMKIVFGEPIDLDEYKNGTSESLEKATDRIMEGIRKLISANKA
jgi:1-acyl-sn-glycerol-3-phosphate acyltransferase